MGSTIIEQDFPYDILHRGHRDAQRHNKRVHEATKKQLKDIISQQDIITNEGNKKVKVRLKYLDQYKFKPYKDSIETIGRDQFDELSEGEVLYDPLQQGSGGPPDKAGDDDGETLYEAEYTIEELTDMMMEDLCLPDLDDSKKNEIISEVLEYTDRRKKTGVRSCLDKKQTLLAYLKRKGQSDSENCPVSEDDLRFRTWNVALEKHSNAVIFLMMDRSGSMWADKIYCVKALYFWIVQFLKRKYDKVEIRFIAHDYNAMELKEKEFFSISDSGGTRVSSAYQLCREIIEEEYSSSIWNIYCFHASDGDTWGDEESDCLELVYDILNLGTTMFAYTEINLERDELSALYENFAEQSEPKILVGEITQLDEVMTVLQSFLRRTLVPA